MWIDDQVLARYDEALALKVFVPETTLVVLGSGNKANLEVDLSYCEQKNVPVTRRYGGGGTVVLYPGCVVVTVGSWMKDVFSNSRYFKMMNEAVISCLADQWPQFKNLSQAGISDIVMGETKVAGTSLFRSRNYLLYQASILVNLDAELVQACLKHPTKEPDYRKGRSHKTFLSSLGEIEPKASDARTVSAVLQNGLRKHVESACAGELILPVSEQMKSLKDRLERAEYLPSPV